MEQEPWQIAATRYCIKNSGNLTKQGLVDFIKSRYTVYSQHIEQFWDEEIFKPPGRNFSRSWINGPNGGIWMAPLDLVSKIVEYDQLQEARQSSKRAMYIAIGSLVLATVVGIAQITIALLKGN